MAQRRTLKQNASILVMCDLARSASVGLCRTFIIPPAGRQMDLDTVQGKRLARILVLVGNAVVIGAIYQLIRGSPLSIVLVVLLSGLAVALVGVMATVDT